MTDIQISILVLGSLIILILVPNIKILSSNKVMIIERLGKFYKIVKGPKVFFTIPLIERNLETISLSKQHVKKTISYQKDETITSFDLIYDMTIFDPKTFVYADFDAQNVIHNFIIDALKDDLSKEEIISEAIKHAFTFGFKIENIQIN